MLIPLSIIITTHNRTNVALETIRFATRNLRYKNIRWIISDDRSEAGHIERLIDEFQNCGVNDVSVCRTSSKRYGLGASLNNGLHEAFKYSDIVLTMEDDWILEKSFNPTYYIKFLKESKDISCIRLAAVNHSVVQDYDNNFRKILAGDNPNLQSTFNLQVALRKKYIYEKVGRYKENCGADETEQDFINRYNKLTNGGRNGDFVVIPRFIPQGTLDNPNLLFTHVGKSTIGHQNFDVPKRFSYIYENKPEDRHPFFRITMPSFNTNEFIERCVRSITNQSFSDFLLVIVDDNSTDGTYDTISRLKQLDNRIISHRMESRSYSGMCRNWSLENTPTPRYDLFIDSDDTYVDSNTLKRIYDHIVENGYPDAVKCSFNYVDHRQRQTVTSKVQFRPRYDSIMRYNAPWTYAVSGKINARFSENQKKFNDVAWSFRMMCQVERYTILDSPTINYNVGENKLSLQYGSDKYDKDSIRSYFQTIVDLNNIHSDNSELMAQIRQVVKNKTSEIRMLERNRHLKAEIENFRREFGWK